MAYAIKTYRVIEGRQAFDVRAKSLESLVRRRYGRTAQIHCGGAYSPHYTITRTDKYGFQIVGRIVK